MRREINRNDTGRQNLKTNYYVDGNTVRRLNGEPEERRRRELEKEQERRRQQHRRAARRNQERALRMNFRYVLFCTAATILFGSVCVAYIQIQADITGRTKNISNLESRIADLQADNDAAVKRIDLSTDLYAVKKKALEYGMKFASPGQIIYYSIKKDDFMDQHSDIPKE